MRLPATVVRRALHRPIRHGVKHHERLQGIAQKNTNLATVAPGISRPVATALGLVAAIPAVIAYNRSPATDRCAHLEGFTGEFRIVSRQIEGGVR